MVETRKLVIEIAVPLLLGIVSAGCGSDSSADIEYFALGASDATGIGATPLTNGYVYRIRDGIEARGKEVDLENLGIPGAEIDNISSIEIPFLERDEPELVTLFTGANDLIDGDDPTVFEQDLQELLQDIRSKAEGGALVVVANLPDLTKAPRFVDDPDPDVTAARVSAFNAAIERQTADAGAMLVDLFSIPLEADLTRDEDGFHPNDAGHQRIADEFLKVIIPQLFPEQNG